MPTSRGTAYSISRNSTRRGDVKTRCDDVGVGPGADSAREETRLIGGIAPGARSPDPVSQPKSVLESSSSSRQARTRGQRLRGRPTRAVVALGQHPVGVREPVELEVVVGRRPARRTPSSTSPTASAPRRLQGERRHDLEGHGGDDAERAQPDPRGLEERPALGRPSSAATVPSAVTSSSPATCADSDAHRAAGAVRPGRERPGDGLPVDVTHVVQGQPEAVQPALSTCSGVPASDRDGHRLAVDRPDAGQPVGAQQQPVGDGDVGEGVARADHLEAEAGPAGGDHRVDSPRRRSRATAPGRDGPSPDPTSSPSAACVNSTGAYSTE